MKKFCLVNEESQVYETYLINEDNLKNMLIDYVLYTKDDLVLNIGGLELKVNRFNDVERDTDSNIYLFNLQQLLTTDAVYVDKRHRSIGFYREGFAIALFSAIKDDINLVNKFISDYYLYYCVSYCFHYHNHIFNALLNRETEIPEYIKIQTYNTLIKNSNIDLLLTKHCNFNNLLLEHALYYSLGGYRKFSSHNFFRLVIRASELNYPPISMHLNISEYGEDAKAKLLLLTRYNIISIYVYEEQDALFEQFQKLCLISASVLEATVQEHSSLGKNFGLTWLYDPIIWMYVMDYI